jgi:ankyrin repeat protein
MSNVRRWLAATIAAVMVAGAVPAAAQFSDGYVFLKAVQDKDATKAREILNKPGTTVVNIRDTKTGETPLIIATKRSDLAWMGFMLQNDANPNLRDNDGNTALTWAAISGFDEGIRVLLLVKARPDVPNNMGETPLIKAVQARDAEAVKQLLEAGANPDITDHAQGYSARQYADQDSRATAIAKLFKAVPVRAPVSQQGPSQ